RIDAERPRARGAGELRRVDRAGGAVARPSAVGERAERHGQHRAAGIDVRRAVESGGPAVREDSADRRAPRLAERRFLQRAQWQRRAAAEQHVRQLAAAAGDSRWTLSEVQYAIQLLSGELEKWKSEKVSCKCTSYFEVTFPLFPLLPLFHFAR